MSHPTSLSSSSVSTPNPLQKGCDLSNGYQSNRSNLQKTPNYNLCGSSLKSDPRSGKADVAGLGFITVDIAKDKATDAAKRINELLKQSTSDQRLKTCATFYHTILVADVPEASQGFKLGNPKFAEQGMNDAADAAEACEKEFSSKSPLTAKNKVVHDLSSIAVAIARLLL